MVENLTITLNVPDGQYLVKWFDPQGAVWLTQQTLTAQSQTLTIPVPAFRDDLAAQVDVLTQEDK